MKLYPIFFIVLMLSIPLLPIARAAPLSDWTIETSINDDKSADWTVTLTYYENVKKSDYFMFARVFNVHVFADDMPVECSVAETVGTTILCNEVDARKLTYKFRTYDSINTVRNFNNFKYRFSIIQLTDKFSLRVYIPLGAAIVEKTRLEGTGMQKFEPSWGREGSDGRRIYVEWLMSTPKLGETFDVSLIYEQLRNIDQPVVQAAIIIIILVAAAVIIFLFKYRKRDIKEMLPVLTDGERKVVEILIREKKPVDQRMVVKETDFSKPKVSRIIHDLEKRGVIEKIHKGRKNILTLKKTRDIEKTHENSQNKAK
jgi:uncharacterized membrane protein